MSTPVTSKVERFPMVQKQSMLPLEGNKQVRPRKPAKLDAVKLPPGPMLPFDLPPPAMPPLAPVEPLEENKAQTATSETLIAPPCPLEPPKPHAPPPTNLAQAMARLPEIASQPAALATMKSGIKAIGRVLGRPLDEITTEPAMLRELFEKASPAMGGVSVARWTHARSLTLRALKSLGVVVMAGRSKSGHSAAWDRLCSQITEKRWRYALSRFLSYLKSKGIEPDEVNAESLNCFHEVMIKTSLRSNPEAAFKVTCQAWNWAVSNVSGWPQVPVPIKTSNRKYALTLDKFPASFGLDVDKFLTRSANQDVFSDDYAPSVRASTNALRRNQILQVASALVASGMPANKITKLAIITKPSNAEAALKYLYQRKGKTKTPGMAQQAQLMRTIAHYWVKAKEDDIIKLRELASKLAPKRGRMTSKNIERLRQFDLPQNVDALLLLPQRVLKKVQKEDDGTRAYALKVMFALSVELLIVAPMRIDNLCELDITKHLKETCRGKSRTRHIAIEKTKTHVRFDRNLSDQSRKFLELYISTYRPRLGPYPENSPENLLFPGRESGKRATTRFSTSISEFIFRETGITMNAQLFRHLAAKLHLTQHPDDIDTVRRLLGHTSSATTSRAYCENRTDGAFRRWDQTLAVLRKSADSPPAPSSRRHTPGVAA